jgi:hypothetical protein
MQIGPTFSLSLYMLFQGHASIPGCANSSKAVFTFNKETLDKTDQGPAPSMSYGLGESQRKPIWQEVFCKARVRLCRAGNLPPPTGSSCKTSQFNGGEVSNQYTYHLEIVEDLDDGRFHDQCENTGQTNDQPNIGLRELVPLHQISKLFYTDTGKILNIGDMSSAESRPVLLVKRDLGPKVQRPEDSGTETKVHQPLVEPLEDEQSDIDRQILGEHVPQSEDSAEEFGHSKSNLPRSLDPEWLAFEVHESGIDGTDSDTEEGEDEGGDGDQSLKDSDLIGSKESSPIFDADVVAQLQNLSLQSKPATDVAPIHQSNTVSTGSEAQEFAARSPFGSVTTSLSLLEMLIRLASLQEFQQASHLAIPDHVLTFFLDETSTTGLVGEARWKARNDTKQRLGFDPYLDSP